jgi:hypothetical protein
MMVQCLKKLENEKNKIPAFSSPAPKKGKWKCTISFKILFPCDFIDVDAPVQNVCGGIKWRRTTLGSHQTVHTALNRR